MLFYINNSIWHQETVCARGVDFSYIVLPLDGDKRWFLWVSSKDLYIERDWNAVVNKEAIFTFNNTLRRSQQMHRAALSSEITLNRWKDSKTKT